MEFVAFSFGDTDNAIFDYGWQTTFPRTFGYRNADEFGGDLVWTKSMVIQL